MAKTTCIENYWFIVKKIDLVNSYIEYDEDEDMDIEYDEHKNIIYIAGICETKKAAKKMAAAFNKKNKNRHIQFYVCKGDKPIYQKTTKELSDPFTLSKEWGIYDDDEKNQ